MIRTIVKGKDWTQRWTADVPEIAPADVSDLMREKLARSSQESLERFSECADYGRAHPDRSAGKKRRMSRLNSSRGSRYARSLCMANCPIHERPFAKTCAAVARDHCRVCREGDDVSWHALKPRKIGLGGQGPGFENAYRFHSTREVQPLPDAWLVDYNEHRP